MHGISVVELGGEKRTLAFNMHCMMFLSQTLKCNPDEIDKKINQACAVTPTRGLTIIVYCGLMGHLEAEAIYDHDITLKQVSTWIGNADFNSFKSVWDAFSDVMGIPKASQEQIDEYVKRQEEKSEVKKKQIPVH